MAWGLSVIHEIKAPSFSEDWWLLLFKSLTRTSFSLAWLTRGGGVLDFCFVLDLKFLVCFFSPGNFSFSFVS